jgi:hypothetical protein
VALSALALTITLLGRQPAAASPPATPAFASQIDA